MFTKNLFKFSALLVVLMLCVAGNTFAQPYSTVYVDVTNGSDTYTGQYASNSPAGFGPKATIGGGLSAVANNGIVIIMAGSYNGVDNLGGAVDISTANYANLLAGGSLTIQLQTLLSNNQVLLSAGNFTYEVSGGTLNITTTTGTEFFTLGAGAATLALGNGTMNSTMNIPTNTFFQLPSGSKIVMNGTSAFSTAAPKAGSNLSLTYQGGGNLTGGPESNYGNYGTGTITVNKTAGTTLTLANAITDNGNFIFSSGNVTFSGNVTVGVAADITNNGTGTITFSSPVGFAFSDGTATANIGSVVNASTGSIVFNSTATWTAGTLTAARIFAAGAGTYIIDNQSTGTINFVAAVTLNNSQATAAWYITATANNAAAGTLSIGTISTPTAGVGVTYVILNVQNTAAGGTLNLAGGTILGTLTNAGTSSVGGALTVTGALTNSGTMALGGSTLTLNGAVANVTTGGTISATGSGNVVASKAGASFNGGTFPALNITGSTVTVSGTATVASLNVTGALAIADGVTLTSTGTVTETGNITVGAGVSGILAMKGDLNRTSGTWLANAGSTVLINGTAAQTINGGPLFQVVGLTFSNTGGIVTLGASIRATGTVTINSGVNVALNTLNIILNATTASMVNNGTYTASGGGGVILGGALTVVGGVSGTGITIGGTGLYSYITVDVGSANTATLSTAAKFTGVLTLRSGALATSTFDLSPNGAAASIVRYVISSPGLNTTGGTFDAANVDYDLTYMETLTGNTSVTAGASEFATAYVRNLTISTPPAAAQTLTLTSATAITVKGDMVVSPNVLFVLDGVAAYNVTLKGNLTIGSGANMSGGNVANTFTLSGDSKSFSVLGTISAAQIFTVTGNGNSLTGSTVTADAATINNVAFEPTANSASFTSTNLKAITAGPVTIQGTSTATSATASIVMNATNASLTGNVAVGSGTVNPTVALTINGSTTSVFTGNVTVTTGTLTLTRGGNSTTNTGNVVVAASGTLVLGSNLTVTGTTTQAGNLNLGAFNYTSQGAYTHSGTGTVTASTGTFVIAATASQAFTATTAVSIPNVQLKASATANVVTLTTANLTVTNLLTLTMGTFDFNALSLVFTGTTITTNVAIAGDVVFLATGGGTLNLGNASGGSITWTSNDAVTTPGTVIVNSTGTVTLVSDKETASTPVARQWSIVNLTFTAGNLVTGINNVLINGGLFDRSAATAGTWSQNGGYLIFNTATAFKPGASFAIDNLEIDQSISSNTVTTDYMTVNKNLLLKAGTLTMNAGLLTLADGCVVERQSDTAMLSAVPTFAGTVSVTYTTGAGGITTVANFKELPSSVTNFSVITPQAVTLPKNVTVTSTLTLSGVLTTTASTKNITMANGATLVLKANGGTVLPITNLDLAGAINITYDGATAVSTRELGAVASGAYTTVTGNVTFKSATVVLDNALTIGGTAKFTGGTFDIGGKNVVFYGDVIQTAAGFVINNTATTANVTFAGATNTVLTLKSTWTLPATGAPGPPTSINVYINKYSASNTITLTGGDLDFATNSQTLYLVNGALVTGGTTSVILKQYFSGTQPTQGFDRSGVSAPGESFIYGHVKKYINKANTVDISNVQFPVGSLTPVPAYRPMTFYFKTAPLASINLTVSQVDGSPKGAVGLPITNGVSTGVDIARYAPFYWTASSDLTLSAADFNLMMTGAGFTSFDDVNNIRIIRRNGLGTDSLNQWLLQGTTYDNLLVNGVPSVQNTNSVGGISVSGAIFTYGLKSNLVVLNPIANQTLNAGGAVAKISMSSPKVFGGNTGTLSYVATSSNTSIATVAISADTIKVTPISAGTATISVTTTDAGDGSHMTTTFTVTVTPVAVTVSGAVTYANTTLNAIGGVTVTLTPATGTALTATTSATGTYSIANVSAGTYTLTASKTGNWGGVTGGDALVVARHAAGITGAALTGLPLAAADVNNSGSVTGADALLIVRRAVGFDASFAAGDWVFTPQPVTVATSNVTANVSGLAVGDANASYTPASGTAFAKSASLSLASGTDRFGISASSPAAIGSVTLRISAKSKIAEISSELPGFVSRVDGSNATLVWYAADAKTAVQLNANDAIATVKLADKAAEGSSVSIATELTDITGAAISFDVAVAALPTEFSLMQNYPNPFNPSTTINYNLPQTGKVTLTVYNVMGQEVAKLVNEQKSAGSYSVEWAPKNLASGMYIYRINVQTEKELLTSSKRLMLLK